MTVSLVGLDLASGKSLFFVVANGEARLLATNYEDARPFYPSIAPGRTSTFIYPDASTFPPGVAGKISYRSGSIENPQIRDIAIKVLEGGEEAFTQRQPKYRVENL
jgi:hypothetical protein